MKSVKNYISIFSIFIISCGMLFACSPGKNIVKNPNSKQYNNNGSIDEFGEEVNDFNDTTVQSNNQDGLNNNGVVDEFPDTSGGKRSKYYQSGTASWYGREFHGKTTASGEKFNMYKLSAAHKTLPFGTVVKVHNLDNGKSVLVRINDRGPYRGNRIIDLSYSAARRIDLVAMGEGKVGIEIVKKGQGGLISGSYVDNNVEPVVDDLYDDSNYGNGNYSLQIGAFYSKRNATKLQIKVQGMVDKPVKVINEDDLYKVRLESISTKSEADRIKQVLVREDIETYLIEK